ncbi:DUF3236 domain-containing protein [Methanotorris igneus]|uniref:Uncharacterized protein n=1 Tax=Methanotorris igneus (strain DSM 5666 / JCM 11834 / Kol 5) TaxID=880724 RepID=F6BF29_METIK|nr:DUF3236 domain-containing protein [Methanotorris igneus]AEF96899.1 hypothetical protein Metig_1364 [Methanotorris igneus Kol 5]
MENLIKKAYTQSIKNKRRGDEEEEVEAIKRIILNAKKIIIATNNQKKFKVISDILSRVVNAKIEMLNINTNCADLTRMPAVSKGLIAVDTEEADVVIARGRLGVPGSGSMLVIMDGKGRILSASLSPSSVVHKEDIETRIKKEIIDALKRVGIELKTDDLRKD